MRKNRRNFYQIKCATRALKNNIDAYEKSGDLLYIENIIKISNDITNYSSNMINKIWI